MNCLAILIGVCFDNERSFILFCVCYRDGSLYQDLSQV